jgi:transposase
LGQLLSFGEEDKMLEVALESKDAPTSDRTSAGRRPIEVITRGERRRRWTAEQKRDIAAESLQPGTSPIMVARKYGISSGLLYTWRQQLLCGALAAVAATQPRFVRVDVVPESSRAAAATSVVPEVRPARPIEPAPAQRSVAPAGRIEIVLRRGATVWVDAQEDEAALRRVLAALKRP